MSAVARQRIWRTADGRHVSETSPEAAFLAYAVGDAIPDEVLEELAGSAPTPAPEPPQAQGVTMPTAVKRKPGRPRKDSYGPR